MGRTLSLGRHLLAGSILVIAVHGADAQMQPSLGGYAVLGIDSVRVAPGVRVQSGAVGATAGDVRLAPHTSVAGSVVADTVHVSRTTRFGRLFCRIVSGGAFGSGVAGGPAVGGAPTPGCLALATPIVAPELLAPVTGSPGSDDLVIPPRTGSAPVSAGSFGAVSVGKGSLLQLAGGAYQFRSVQLRRAARLVCLDECRIGVAEGIRLGPAAQLGAAQGLRPDRARVDVAAVAGEFAFRAGPHAVVAATIFAPTGNVLLGPDGDYRGAFVGKAVKVRSRSHVRETSALALP
jgi:hypothetical protein